MNKRKIIKQICFWAILLISAWQIQAQDYSKKVVKETNINQLELLRLIFPDLSENGEASQTVKIRSTVETDEIRTFQGAMEVEIVREERLNSENGKRLMLIIKVSSTGSNDFAWGELNLLALFNLAGKPRLLDVVEISADRENYYWGNLKISPKITLTVMEASHLNAGEDYHLFNFFYVKKDKFTQTLEEFPMLYSGRGCESQIIETGKLSTIPSAKKNFRDVIFKIKVTSKKFASDCERVKSQTNKNFTLRAIWQNGKFKLSDNSVLKTISREEKRMGFEN